MVYSADTGPEWSIERLGRGVDLKLVEATYGTDAEADGMTSVGALQVRCRAAEAKRCVLTHFGQSLILSVHARNGESAYGVSLNLHPP